MLLHWNNKRKPRSQDRQLSSHCFIISHYTWRTHIHKPH